MQCVKLNNTLKIAESFRDRRACPSVQAGVPVSQPKDKELRCENPQLAYHRTPTCNMYCVGRFLFY
jgi:hypothetical protein